MTTVEPMRDVRSATGERQRYVTAGGFTNRPALSPAQLTAAQEIRFRAYHGAGWIDWNEAESFGDEYDALPNAQTHVLCASGVAVGAMRTNVWTGRSGWDRVPAMRVFDLDLPRLLDGETFVELSRFAICPRFRGSTRTAQLALMNNAVHAADRHRCRYMVAAVRESHVPFYEKLEFHVRAPAVAYPGLRFATALMVMDWRDARPRLATHRLFGCIFTFPRVSS